VSAEPAPVVWFDELEGDVRAVAGGKCASLVEMRRAGFPVPPGFAITVAAFEQFGEDTGIGSEVERLVAMADPDSMESLRVVSEQIEALAANVRLPASLMGLVGSAYQRVGQETGENDPAVAVRSSAVGEDSAGASFAGQQETYLWVRGLTELELAVRRCWVSYFSPHALSYRARLAGGAGFGTVGMSVGVQQMADAYVAGVMFTRSPTKNDRSIVAIEAGLGLGISVVAGEITPDEIWVNKVTREIVRRQPGNKQVRYVPDRDTGGTRFEEVPQDEATRLCLDDETAKQLAEYGVRLERHYGAAQDIEWALTRGPDGTSTLILLQSRPITTGQEAKEPVTTPLPSESALPSATDYVVKQLLATSKKKVQM
jgi:phosphoenolpyruvate synthase/pyruvate phosphate dikinase